MGPNKNKRRQEKPRPKASTTNHVRAIKQTSEGSKQNSEGSKQKPRAGSPTKTMVTHVLRRNLVIFTPRCDQRRNLIIFLPLGPPKRPGPKSYNSIHWDKEFSGVTYL